LSVLSQYFIKVNSQKFNLNFTFAVIILIHACSLLEGLYFACLLFLMLVYLLVKIFLTCSTQESWQSRFSHSRKTYWYQYKFINMWLLLNGHVLEQILIKLVFELA
jgi:hypothetical protein